MAGSFSSLLTDAIARPKPGDRLYAAALGGCLAFLFAIAWLQTPITGYQAASVLAWKDGQGGSQSTSSFLRQPDERAAIEHWFAAEQVASDWQDGEKGVQRLRLTLVAPVEQQALTRLDAVARRFVGEYFQQREQAAHEALLIQQRERLAEARLQEEVLEQNVTQALAELQSATMEAEARWRETQEARAQKALAALAEKHRSPPPPTPNPDWTDLAASLARREAEASRLLLKFTRNHPLLASMEIQLAALRKALAQTPRYLQNELRDGDPSPESGDDTESPDLNGLNANEVGGTTPDAETIASAAAPLRLGALSDRLEQLREQFAAARETRSQAELALVETLGGAREPVIRTSLSEPAQLAVVFGGKTTKTGLAAAVIAALFVGSGIWGAYRSLSPERLETSRQLERRIPLPLLSAVRSGPAPQAAPSPGERCIWWFLRGCEGTLVLLLALAAITLIADSQLSQVFVSDPLRAAGEVITRWR
jgi:hypothetical protein